MKIYSVLLIHSGSNKELFQNKTLVFLDDLRYLY